MILSKYREDGFCHIEFKGDIAVIAVELIELARKMMEQEPEIIQTAIELLESEGEETC